MPNAAELRREKADSRRGAADAGCARAERKRCAAAVEAVVDGCGAVEREV